MENKLGYNFKDKKLLKKALTHPSFSSGNENIKNYERLEFLGDSVLAMVMSEYLFTNFPDEKEGGLAKRRSALVCGDTIAKVAKNIDIGKYLILSAGEEAGGGRDNSANLENALEALMGAIFLDGGMEESKKFILDNFAPLAAEMKEPPRDTKTHLQEWVQSIGKALPAYKVVAQVGPAHAPIFIVEVTIDGYSSARGEGTSKKKAEIDAAGNMLDKASRR